jgi:nitrogen fixation protein FixH
MKRGLGWPVGMGVILALTVAANVGMIMLARGDPSFAVEPDYYRKAVQWDDAMAQERANAALGWRLVPSLTLAAGAPARLVVQLADAAGAPLAGATLTVQAMHNARAAEVFEATLAASGAAGTYEAALPLRRAGQWELRFDVRRGAERFTARARVEAAGRATAARSAARGVAPGAAR